MVIFMLNDLGSKTLYSFLSPFAFLVLPADEDFVVAFDFVIEAVFFETIATFFVNGGAGFFYRGEFRVNEDFAEGNEQANVSAYLWRRQPDRITPAQFRLHEAQHLICEIFYRFGDGDRFRLFEEYRVGIFDEFHDCNLDFPVPEPQ
jgi:hypothetical protein